MRLTVVSIVAAGWLLAPALVNAEPTTAVSVDPTGWLAHRYSADVAHAVSDHVVVRVGGTLYPGDKHVANDHSDTVTVTAPVFLDRAFQGPFVELGGAFHSQAILGLGELPADGSPPMVTTERAHAVDAVGYVGWQWAFASRFQLSIAIGASRRLSGSPAVGLGGIGSLGIGSLGATTDSYIRAGYTW